tara:strand:+ start:2834 stop:3901 length:1068 start_codon:yes stop_codon:yes gene_type:complete
MKLLITGGAGFIGSAVLRNLLKNSDIEIINIDKLTYAGNLESLSDLKNSERHIHERVDICNKDEISALFRNHKPDMVMHLAAESHVDRSIDASSDFIHTNIIGTYVLLESAREYYKSLDHQKKNKFRFHHVSTDEVYGDLGKTKDLFTEETCYSPSSPYSASKASSDHLVRAWGRTYKLPIIITNCSNNYGPYHFPEKLIPHMILSAIHGKSLPIYGDGSQIRDWLYVDDHANALVKVITKGKIGETYNIGGNNEKSNLEVVELICKILEDLAPSKPNGVKKYSDLITFVEDRPGHDVRYAIDSSKISKELDWRPKESFESGLKKTVKWYINNNQWWERVLSGEYRLHRIGKNDE